MVCNALFLYNDISRFEKLKFIQLTSAGLDRVPLDHITAKGIRLCRAEKVYSIPMAEWVILKILESTSRVSISLRPRQTADGISGAIYGSCTENRL